MNIFLGVKDRFILSSTSKGNQTKWIKGNYYIKADSMGYEGLAEKIVSILEKYVMGIKFVGYETCTIHENNKIHNGCISINYKEFGESSLSFANILEKVDRDFIKKLSKYSSKDKLQIVRDGIYNSCGIDTLNYMGINFMIDSLTLNEDRHLNNLEVISGLGYTRQSPIFDNGLSLLSDISDYPFEYSTVQNVKRVKAKPFSTSFEKQVDIVRELGVNPLIIDIEGLTRGIGQLRVLNYADVTVNRAKKVLLERLRKMEGISWVKV